MRRTALLGGLGLLVLVLWFATRPAEMDPGPARNKATDSPDEARARAGLDRVGENGADRMVEAPVARPDGSRSVTVRVLGPDGKPVRDGFVSFVVDGGITSVDIEDGSRTLTVPRDSPDFTVVVIRATDAAGHPTAPGSFGPFPAGIGTVALHLAKPKTIEGRVIDARDDPVSGITITAKPLPDDETWFSKLHTVKARTNAGGRFRFPGLGTSTYRLRVIQQQGLKAVPAVDVPSGTHDVIFRLAVEESVLIRVLDDRGEPSAGAYVVAQAEDQRPWAVNGRTDLNGDVKLFGLSADATFSLLVVPPRGDAGVVSRYEQAGWTPQDTVIRLTRISTVRGVVLGPSGEPLSGVVVWVREANGPWWRRSMSAKDGTFVLTWREAAPLALRATPPGASWSEDGVEEVVARGGDRGVVLRTDPGHGLIVRIRNQPESDVTWAELASETRPGIRRRNVSNGPEVLLFFGLKPGDRWTLRIVGAGKLALRKPGVRSEAGSIEVTLGPGKTIRGRMVLPAGADRLGVRAESATLVVRGVVDAKGRFEITGLTEGTWRVCGICRVSMDLWSAEAEVAAGEEVELLMTKVTR